MVDIKRKYSQKEAAHPVRGRLYCNPDDKNLFVRRQTPFAWTINLGNPWAWCVVGGIALVICAAVYWFIAI